MKNDTIDTLFKNLEGHFNLESPDDGHKKRFLNKLNAANNKSVSKRTWLKPFSIAASVLIIFGLGLTLLMPEATQADLASVSPEMEKTQSFFTMAINKELESIKLKESPETKPLINDAMIQLERLEAQYQTLKTNLVESGNDKRVIHAMIQNYQNRITLLEDLLKTIRLKRTEQLKFINHETTI